MSPSHRLRRTKIIATLGPATQDLDYLCQVLQAGVNVVRINFSHGNAESQCSLIELARTAAKKIDREIGIIADLQGPKIRVAKFKTSNIYLTTGTKFCLNADLADDAGDENQVGITYKALPQDVSVGDTLLLDDGRIELAVENISDNKINCTVTSGGALSNNKGINRLGGGLSAAALTDKDKTDLITAVNAHVDYIAISFPRCAEDIFEAKALIRNAGGDCAVIAKIERAEAVEKIDELIKSCEAVMVARGDLGVEIGDAEVPGVQKTIIERARQLNKISITATQMMESMIENAIPTRAEASDVANAVLDGTDAVMLSAETATGKHPHKVVTAMSRICLSAENNPITQVSDHRVTSTFQRIDEAIAMATMYTANHIDIKAIIALTESGSTPLWMSRIRSGIPIYGLTRNLSSHRRMTLFRGVYPLSFDPTTFERDYINSAAVAKLIEYSLIDDGDMAIITKGNAMGNMGGTNAMKIVTVGKPM